MSLELNKQILNGSDTRALCEAETDQTDRQTEATRDTRELCAFISTHSAVESCQSQCGHFVWQNTSSLCLSSCSYICCRVPCRLGYTQLLAHDGPSSLLQKQNGKDERVLHFLPADLFSSQYRRHFSRYSEAIDLKWVMGNTLKCISRE
jgi:hypothetical protein